MQPDKKYTDKQIRLAVIEECGTDERTIRVNVERLIELKMISPRKKEAHKQQTLKQSTET